MIEILQDFSVEMARQIFDGSVCFRGGTKPASVQNVGVSKKVLKIHLQRIIRMFKHKILK